MDNKAVFIARRLASLSFTLGAISVILSLLLTISPIAVDASGEVKSVMAETSAGNCGSDYVFKIDLSESASGYTYTSNVVITSLIIKAGSEQQGEACYVFTSNGPAGCYAVSGLGTNTVTVTELGGSGCKDISHIEFYSNPPPADTSTPTSTSTSTDTAQPPANTSTPTATSTSTNTALPPTNTFTPTSTNTATNTVSPPVDTPTPTNTATGTLSPPVNTSTPTPTSTGTDIINPPANTSTPTSTVTSTVQPPANTSTATPTSTGTSIVMPPVPSATATPTNTALPPVSNSPTPTDVVQPPVAGTLPPPSEPQPRFKQPELFPVTGGEHLVRIKPMNKAPQELFLNVGLGLLGVSLVFFGLSKKLQ